MSTLQSSERSNPRQAARDGGLAVYDRNLTSIELLCYLLNSFWNEISMLIQVFKPLRSVRSVLIALASLISAAICQAKQGPPFSFGQVNVWEDGGSLTVECTNNDTVRGQNFQLYVSNGPFALEGQPRRTIGPGETTIYRIVLKQNMLFATATGLNAGSLRLQATPNQSTSFTVSYSGYSETFNWGGNGTPSYDLQVPLEVILVHPEVVDFSKRVLQQGSGLWRRDYADLLGWLLWNGGLPSVLGHTKPLFTRIRWESSSGDVRHLQGAQIFEMLRTFPDGLIADPSDPEKFLPPFPWTAGVESIWGTSTINFSKGSTWDASKGVGKDMHGDQPWALPPSPTQMQSIPDGVYAFSIEQEYRWTAPWLDSETKAKGVFLARDRVWRKIKVTTNPNNGEKGLELCYESTLGVGEDCYLHGKAAVELIPTIDPATQPEIVMVWRYGRLEQSISVDGPWTTFSDDSEGAVLVNIEAGARFFRVIQIE